MWNDIGVLFLYSADQVAHMWLDFNNKKFVALLADAEEDVQEQAISLVQNLVYGDPDSVDQIFADERILLQAVEMQLVTSRPGISLQVGLHIVQSISLNLCSSFLID